MLGNERTGLIMMALGGHSVRHNVSKMSGEASGVKLCYALKVVAFFSLQIHLFIQFDLYRCGNSSTLSVFLNTAFQ